MTADTGGEGGGDGRSDGGGGAVVMAAAKAGAIAVMTAAAVGVTAVQACNPWASATHRYSRTVILKRVRPAVTFQRLFLKR